MGSIKKAFKKIIGRGGSTNHTYKQPTPAPELGNVTTDTTDITEELSEKEQLSRGKKKGKKGLKIDRTMVGGHAGRNIT